MAAGFRVEGAEQLHVMAQQLRAAGDKKLKRDLLKGMRDATKPAAPAVRASALAMLPKHGGLNEVVAASKVGTRTRLSGQTASVDIVGTNLHNIRAMDRGRLRHPVFGNRDVWVTQDVVPGWFTEPLRRLEPQMAAAVEKVMDRTAATILSR